MTAAFLFDFDGVVADTPHLNFRAWETAFLERSIQISALDYYRMEGNGPRGIARHFCIQHGLDLALEEELAERKHEVMAGLGVPIIYPEIPQLLSLLRDRGVRLALVSGASRLRISNSLPDSLAYFFEKIITSDDVHLTKPNPEPYIKAADALGISPNKSVVVENAPLGIRAAKDGGFFCIAVGTTLSVEELCLADSIVPDHAALVGAISCLLDRR